MSIGILVLTFALLYEKIDYVWHIGENGDPRGPLVSLVVIIILCCTSLLTSLIWLRRGDHLIRDILKGDEFVVILIIGRFLRTLSETIGIWIGTTFSLLTVVAFILLQDADSLIRVLDLDNLPFARNADNLALGGVVIFPLFGWMIILLGNLISEGITTLAAIANNTRSLRPQTNSDAIELELTDDEDVIVLDMGSK